MGVWFGLIVTLLLEASVGVSRTFHGVLAGERSLGDQREARHLRELRNDLYATRETKAVMLSGARGEPRAPSRVRGLEVAFRPTTGRAGSRGRA